MQVFTAECGIAPVLMNTVHFLEDQIDIVYGVNYQNMKALFEEETGAEVGDPDAMNFNEFWDGVEVDF